MTFCCKTSATESAQMINLFEGFDDVILLCKQKIDLNLYFIW